jgi:hypothetical protein
VAINASGYGMTLTPSYCSTPGITKNGDCQLRRVFEIFPEQNNNSTLTPSNYEFAEFY